MERTVHSYPKPREVWNILLELPEETKSNDTSLLDLRPSKLKGDKFLLFKAIQFMVIRYSSPKKLISQILTIRRKQDLTYFQRAFAIG